MRHVSRTHRVNLDWLYARFLNDPGFMIKYLRTKFQIADILTKGSFNAEQWNVIIEFSDTKVFIFCDI